MLRETDPQATLWELLLRHSWSGRPKGDSQGPGKEKMSELVSTGAHATPCEAACHLRPGPTRWVVRTGQIFDFTGVVG